MRIPCRRHWLLRRMNRRLCRSDPHLAAMLAIFARLYAAEAIMSKEQAAWPGTRAWRRLAGLAGTAVRAAAVLVAAAVRAFRRSMRAAAMTGRRISRAIQAALAIPPSAGPPVRRSGTGLPAG